MHNQMFDCMIYLYDFVLLDDLSLYMTEQLFDCMSMCLRMCDCMILLVWPFKTKGLCSILSFFNLFYVYVTLCFLYWMHVQMCDCIIFLVWHCDSLYFNCIKLFDIRVYVILYFKPKCMWIWDCTILLLWLCGTVLLCSYTNSLTYVWTCMWCKT